jgi:DNA polymerase
MESLEDVARLVKNCTDCQLHRGRTNAVPGEGNPQADIMFIGEGPGFREDREGRPFVGPAGQLLESLLASIGTNRKEVFIANMVKCRPPDNRDPAPPEIAACGKYLDRQIELINPKLIVTLGRFSLGRFSPGESIMRVRGKARQKDGRTIFPVLHPAAVLRRQELRGIMDEDFQAISRILEDSQQPVSVPPATDLINTEQIDQQPADRPEQLTFMSERNTPVDSPAPIENTVNGPNEAAQSEQLTLF